LDKAMEMGIPQINLGDFYQKLMGCLDRLIFQMLT